LYPLACVTAGLVCAEYYKSMQRKGSVGHYRNYFINVGISCNTSSKPAPSKIIKWHSIMLNEWDVIEIYGNLTISQLLQYIETKYAVKITLIAYGYRIIWMEFANQTKNMINDTPIFDIISASFNDQQRNSLNKKRYVLDITTDTVDDNPHLILFPCKLTND